MLQQVDDLYDKLQGTKNGGRRGRGRSEDAISPIEMLQSLQQLVDEHGAMEQESLAKDEELSRLRQQLAEARERQVRETDANEISSQEASLTLLRAGCAGRGEASVLAAAKSVRSNAAHVNIPFTGSMPHKLRHLVLRVSGVAKVRWHGGGIVR